MSTQQTATDTPAAQLVEVLKSLAESGQRKNPDIVRKRADEMTLAEFGAVMVELLMREAIQQDPFLTKAQVRRHRAMRVAARLMSLRATLSQKGQRSSW